MSPNKNYSAGFVTRNPPVENGGPPKFGDFTISRFMNLPWGGWGFPYYYVKAIFYKDGRKSTVLSNWWVDIDKYHKVTKISEIGNSN